jgi:hypothetical protein
MLYDFMTKYIQTFQKLAVYTKNSKFIFDSVQYARYNFQQKSEQNKACGVFLYFWQV